MLLRRPAGHLGALRPRAQASHRFPAPPPPTWWLGKPGSQHSLARLQGGGRGLAHPAPWEPLSSGLELDCFALQRLLRLCRRLGRVEFCVHCHPDRSSCPAHGRVRLPLAAWAHWGSPGPPGLSGGHLGFGSQLCYSLVLESGPVTRCAWHRAEKFSSRSAMRGLAGRRVGPLAGAAPVM